MLSELQKDAKEGAGDEVAVLRRERKRRRESESVYRENGRDDLADTEAQEAATIETYLPAELSDDELDALVATAVAETGAEGPRDMGKAIKHVMAAAGGRVDGKRVSGKVKEALTLVALRESPRTRTSAAGAWPCPRSGQGLVLAPSLRPRQASACISPGHARTRRRTTVARRQLELSNEVAAELAGAQDQILRTLEEHLDCAIFLRGNVVTLDGDADAVQAAATVVRELSSLVARGHELGPATIESVTRVLDERESPAQVLEDVVWRHRNLKVAPKSVNQKRYVDAIRRSTITFGVGPAGTGKTFLAIAMAVAALSRREVNRIILTRPAVEAGERLGFLPGDLMAKVDPYLRPLFDALHDMLDAERVAAHLERSVIEVAPLAFMRGRTLNDSFVILDEAQNTSPEQMKMFLTRLGFGSKMVVTGDITQVDLPRDQKSGLVVVADILSGVEGVEFIRFGGEDVVRHKLVQRIVAAYDEHSTRAAPELRPAPPRRRTS